MSWLGFFRGIVHGAEVIEHNPITGVVISAINPAAGLWWTQVNSTLTTLEQKYGQQDGKGPLMKAEAMATDPEIVKSINETLALTGKQWVGDPALISKAIDDAITSKNSIKAAAASFRVVDIAPAPPPPAQ